MRFTGVCVGTVACLAVAGVVGCGSTVVRHAGAPGSASASSEPTATADLSAGVILQRARAAGARVSSFTMAFSYVPDPSDPEPLHRSARPYNGEALHDSGDDLPWRQVRLLALRARYALEVCAPLLGPAAAGSTTGLAELARLLGQHQEATDAAGAAALAGATPRITPATAYVLGVVHADQRLEVEAARHAFSLAWPDIHHPDWLSDTWLTH